MTLSSDTKHPVRTAILLSVLLHLFFAWALILTFPLQPVALKPTFVFWGSILQQRDLFFASDTGTKKASTAWAENIRPALTHTDTSGILNLTKPAQPIPEKNRASKSYQTLKDTMTTETVNDADEQNLGIDRRTPEREPLKLPFLW